MSRKTHQFTLPGYIHRIPPSPGGRERELHSVNKRVQWRGDNPLEIQSFVDTYGGVQVEFTTTNGVVRCVVAGEVIPVGAYLHVDLRWSVAGPKNGGEGRREVA